MADRDWVALFSGGKDSYLALRSAWADGLEVNRLLTVYAHPGSFVFHTPAIEATSAIATAVGCEHITLEAPAADTTDSQRAADRELVVLERWLAAVADSPDAPAGLVTGVVASEYQRERLDALVEQFDMDLYAPLWNRSGASILSDMHSAELSVDIVGVAAAGLDRSWLGRRLDAGAVEDLIALAERTGIHPAGEGGEFETLVVDAPAFSAQLHYEATTHWDGSRGHLELDTVRLGATDDR